MAKVLDEVDRKDREDDLYRELSNEVYCIIKRFQDGYGIRNVECPPELVIKLDLAIENVREVIEEILDLQTEIDNRERFYAINFKMQIKAASAEEALDKLKGEIDSVSDIADLLDVKEMEVEE